MVVFVAKQAVNSTDLQDFNFSWKNGSGRITERKNGELWYKITDIKLAENKFVKLIKDGDIQKLFENDESFTGSDFDDNLVARGGNDVVKGKGEGATQ